MQLSEQHVADSLLSVVCGIYHAASSWPLSEQPSLPIIVAPNLCLDLGIWIHQVAHGLVMVQGVDDV